VCSRKSEISALVEKKTGFDGSLTLIHSGLRSWWSWGSILGRVDTAFNQASALGERNLVQER